MPESRDAVEIHIMLAQTCAADRTYKVWIPNLRKGEALLGVASLPKPRLNFVLPLNSAPALSFAPLTYQVNQHSAAWYNRSSLVSFSL